MVHLSVESGWVLRLCIGRYLKKWSSGDVVMDLRLIRAEGFSGTFKVE